MHQHNAYGENIMPCCSCAQFMKELAEPKPAPTASQKEVDGATRQHEEEMIDRHISDLSAFSIASLFLRSCLLDDSHGDPDSSRLLFMPLFGCGVDQATDAVSSLALSLSARNSSAF